MPPTPRTPRCGCCCRQGVAAHLCLIEIAHTRLPQTCHVMYNEKHATLHPTNRMGGPVLDNDWACTPIWSSRCCSLNIQPSAALNSHRPQVSLLGHLGITVAASPATMHAAAASGSLAPRAGRGGTYPMHHGWRKSSTSMRWQSLNPPPLTQGWSGQPMTEKPSASAAAARTHECLLQASIIAVRLLACQLDQPWHISTSTDRTKSRWQHGHRAALRETAPCPAGSTPPLVWRHLRWACVNKPWTEGDALSICITDVQYLVSVLCKSLMAIEPARLV
jgi:hypothetical protein